jgi:hypothetical protein
MIKKKVVVFESDDWGTIRTPSRAAYERMNDAGLKMDANPYNRVDALETEADMEALYQVLNLYKDKKERPPVFTTNFIAANPDFDKIRAANFQEYYFKDFLATYKSLATHDNCWNIIRDGIKKGFIRPQFHGREHINVQQWLNLLQEGDGNVHKAFDEGFFSLDISMQPAKRNNLMASLDCNNSDQQAYILDSLVEGIHIFNRLFGFQSQSFIAPCNVWNEAVEQQLSLLGVKYIQSLFAQKVPVLGNNTYDVKHNITGSRSNSNQIYLVRNAYFEPATSAAYPWVKNCLKKIEAAFFWSKPAIISTHRLNYIGSIVERNRTENLEQLNLLLKEIVSRWPDVEFLSSDELGLLYE